MIVMHGGYTHTKVVHPRIGNMGVGVFCMEFGIEKWLRTENTLSLFHQYCAHDLQSWVLCTAGMIDRPAAKHGVKWGFGGGFCDSKIIKSPILLCFTSLGAFRRGAFPIFLFL